MALYEGFSEKTCDAAIRKKILFIVIQEFLSQKDIIFRCWIEFTYQRSSQLSLTTVEEVKERLMELSHSTSQLCAYCVSFHVNSGCQGGTRGYRMERVKEGTPIFTVIGKPLHILVQTFECDSFAYIHYWFYQLSPIDLYLCL